MSDQHNFEKIFYWIRNNRPENIDSDGVLRAYVLHDDWCAIWYGGICACSPEVKVNDRAVNYPKEILTHDTSGQNSPA